MAAVTLAVGSSTASPGNGNTTIGVAPPAPPTGAVTASPNPTAGPTNAPTSPPTVPPTTKPTAAPSAAPTAAPTPVPRAPVLKPSTVAADNAAFVGSAAANTTTLSLALSGGDAGLLQKLTIAPGVEIRSADKLTLASDWNLAPFVAGPRVGEAAVITLRAVGNLLLSNSLSDGFAAAASATDKRAIAADGLAQLGTAASFRLVGGADLSAADPLAVQAGRSAGVTVGRVAAANTATPPIVLIRSTTGSIAIAAAGDISLGTALDGNSGKLGQVRVYTTGEPVLAIAPSFVERAGIRANDQLIRDTSGSLGPFYENAGDISLSAGRDLRGLPSTIYASSGNPSGVQYVSDWWWRQTNPTTPDKGLALWSRYDLFAQGIASFGGGDITLRAGRDLIDVDASTPASGYSVPAGKDKVTLEPLEAQSRWWAGGSLDVQAARDVIGGLFNAGGPTARLMASGTIAGNSGQARSYAAPQLFYLDTAWTVSAGGDVQLGSLTNAAALSGARQGIDNSPRADSILGLAPHASAQVLSVAGSVQLLDARPVSASGSRPGAGAVVVPDGLTGGGPGGAT
ncbi:MAG: hypothetical protein H7242_13260, partial [Microbacteriaceae bacterium]|nr:hypothetical protein [Burkholderiaceae bacterium]